jgi:hypothetical protein
MKKFDAIMKKMNASRLNEDKVPDAGDSRARLFIKKLSMAMEFLQKQVKANSTRFPYEFDMVLGDIVEGIDVVYDEIGSSMTGSEAVEEIADSLAARLKEIAKYCE